jgi:hypothetical protein
MTVIYDVRGTRPEGAPTSTEEMNIRTLGGARAVAVRLRREGYATQITHRVSGAPTAQVRNPFEEKAK